MDNIVQAMMGAAGQGGGLATDPNFNQTVLLLHGDGTNGAQNNTFLDSSSNTFTITRNGNTTQGTFSPFSSEAGKWSNYFDGNDYLSISDSTAFNMGSGDFTCECWIYTTNAAATSAYITTADTTDFQGFFLGQDSGSFFLLADSGSTPWDVSISGGTVVANTWTHVAGVRNGNVFTLYINGTSVGTTTQSITLGNSNNKIVVGGRTVNSQYFAGYISNARVVKGTAVYTSGFTPSTSPLTAVSGTSLLTCQSNRFIDNSTNAFAITVNGNPSVQPFSPFAPSAAYSASVNGGSGYFDGSGDYLTVPANAAWSFTGDACLEAWVYRTADLSGIIFATGNASSADQFAIFASSEGLWWGQSSSTSSRPGINRWSHVCVTRSGSTIRRFIDGELVSTGTNSGTIGSSVVTAYIGRRPSGGTEFNGYIQDLRIINGSIPTDYQTASTTTGTQIFTPPTAPLTTTSQGATSGDVELLLNFTNAGIFDNTAKNDLETVGNAQIDTTTKKYGTGSMEFDGTGDYLVTPTSSNIQFGTGDYTVEMWIYKDSSGSGERGIFATQDSGIEGVSIWADGTAIYFEERPTAFSGVNRITGTISQNAFVHIAAVRYNGTFYGYVNGVSAGNTASSKNLTGSRVLVGNNPSTANPMKGYIDDLRITKGVARYTAAFTPPTAAFPDL